MDAWDTYDKITNGERSRKLSEDDWLQIQDEIIQFLKEDHPEEEKQLFAPFGWLESVVIICDGIKRMRASICYKCRKMARVKFSESCEVYESIPKEIWTVRDGECPYFEPLQGEK